MLLREDIMRYVVNKVYLVFWVVPIILMGKFLRFTIMEKLIDNASANIIISMMKYPERYNPVIWGDDTFWLSAQIFKSINFFRFSSPIQWEVFLTIIFNIILIKFYLGLPKKIEITCFISLLCSIGLLNIFVFTLSKDILQFVVFIAIFFVIDSKKVKEKIKVLVSLIILACWGVFFRKYYLIIGFFVLIFFIMIKNSNNKNKNINIKSIIKFYFIFICMLQIGRLVLPELYQEVILVKYKTLYNLKMGGAYPVTAIKDLIQNTNLISFTINHIISVIRMLIPIELIKFGIKYYPFLIYQVFVSYNLYKAWRNTRYNSLKKNIALCIYIAFILGSAIFEPDFGSWVRHEIAAFPIIYILIKEEKIEYERIESNA